MILSLVACSHIEGDSRQLFVTIEPYRFVVEAVAGEEWNVCSIVSNGGNPETFDPMPSDLLALASSKAYFMVGGLGFENGWKEKIAELYPHLLLVDTSQGIERDEEKRIILEAVCSLSKREREIIELRFGLGGRREMTQKETAKALGISQSYISRLEKKIMLRLRKEILRQTSCA